MDTIDLFPSRGRKDCPTPKVEAFEANYLLRGDVLVRQPKAV